MNPLSDVERAAMNSTATPEHERTRLYARDLRATAEAYAKAADAPGLPKNAAAFLFRESIRLTNESGHYFDRADREEAEADEGRCREGIGEDRCLLQVDHDESHQPESEGRFLRQDMVKVERFGSAYDGRTGMVERIVAETVIVGLEDGVRVPFAPWELRHFSPEIFLHGV